MTFDHPWALLLVLLPALWAVWDWRSSSRRVALLLKAGAFAAIALALAGPRLTVYQNKVAVAMLADTSASVSAEDLQSESAFADKLERARGRHWTRIIPFARATRAAAADERPKNAWQLHHTAGAAGHGTNLESAIRDGAASLPAGMAPRLLLVKRTKSAGDRVDIAQLVADAIVDPLFPEFLARSRAEAALAGPGDHAAAAAALCAGRLFGTRVELG